MDWTLTAIILAKAAAIGMLLKIAITDFRIQKIRNADLTVLLALAFALLTLGFMRAPQFGPALIALAAAGVVFLLLVGFWLAGKVGAGDVKLLAIVPLLIGMSGLGPFVVGLLVFSLLTAMVMKYPTLLPESAFRSYVSSLSQTGRVPFGVPISMAAIVGLLVGA